jgi:hypothetical protein
MLGFLFCSQCVPNELPNMFSIDRHFIPYISFCPHFYFCNPYKQPKGNRFQRIYFWTIQSLIRIYFLCERRPFKDAHHKILKKN